MSRFVIRLDDITPGMAWSKFEPLQEALDEVRARPVVGVVPDSADEALAVEPEPGDYWDRVRSWRSSGWTIAQHGYRHVYDTDSGGYLRAKPRSEFAGHSLEEQQRRLSLGKSILVREGVWQPVFMAPGHSFDLLTLKALTATGFRCVTDGYGLSPYVSNSLVFVPQLFASPRHIGFGTYTICLHVNTMSADSIEKMCAFIRMRSDNIISLGEAIERRPIPILPKAVRRSLELAVPALRWARGNSVRHRSHSSIGRPTPSALDPDER